MTYKVYLRCLWALLYCAVISPQVLAQTTSFRSSPVNANDRGITAPPPANVTESEYRLGPEDLIEVFVWNEPDLTVSVPVRPDGKVSLPLTGEIVASGRTASELQTEIATKLHKFVTTPTVNVIVKEVNSPTISILGEVKKPDVYKLKQRITALDAIARAGGFSDYAKRNRVIIIRNTETGSKRIELNLDRDIKEAKDPPFYLQAFDKIYVE